MFRSHRAHAMAFMLAAGACAGVSHAAQIVYLNFGSLTETQAKTSNNILNEDGTTSYTLVKGARLGYRPTDIGYANNDDRAAHITALVAQITANYADGGNPYNISFVTTQPANGVYTTMNIVSGPFPNFRLPLGGVSMLFNLTTQRATIEGGAMDGYYLDLTAKKSREPTGRL